MWLSCFPQATATEGITRCDERTPPILVVKVPLNSLAETRSKIVCGFPAQVTSYLFSVDCVTLIVPWPVLDEGN